MENQQKPSHNHQEPDSQQKVGCYYREPSGSSAPTKPIAAKTEEAVNTSCNHNGTSCIFDMPECVIDVYLEAINGGSSRDERFRSLSQRYGQPDLDIDLDLQGKSDSNCNHNVQEVPPGYCGGCHPDKCHDHSRNVNPEPHPHEGCGCSFSYNGGAGAGTADCGCDAYDKGFKDKKRDHSCPCSSPEARRSHGMGHHSHSSHHECPYEKELCNKKAVSSCCTGLSEVEYKPEDVNNKPVLPSCCCEGGPYEKDLINKKPSICSPCGPEFHPSCEPKKLHCHQSEYRTRPHDIPDRRCFYSDEECGNTSVVKRCNNNSCNIDLVFNDDNDDPCAVGVPCVAEASYFHSNQLGIQATAFFPQMHARPMPTRDTEDEDDEEEEERKTAISEKVSVSPMYTTEALESDEAADHLLPELTGGKKWQVGPQSMKGRPNQRATSYVNGWAIKNEGDFHMAYFHYTKEKDTRGLPTTLQIF